MGMDYHEQLAAVREMKHRELVKLAEKTGVAIQTLREIKYGRGHEKRQLNPTLSTLEKLSLHFTKKARRRSRVAEEQAA